MNKREIISIWLSAFGVSAFAMLLSVPLILWGLHPISEAGARLDSLAFVFSEQLRAGNFMPRWIPSMHLGRGSPVFFFEAPLAYYFRSFLSFGLDALSLRQLDTLAAGVHAAVMLVAAALAFFSWLIRIAHARVAVYGALLYTMLPSHLLLHTVVESDANLQWAYVLMPLGLRCVDSMQLRHRTGLLGVTLVLFLFFLSSPTTAFFFSLLLFCYSFLCPKQLAESEHYSRDAARLALFSLYGILLGAGAAAYYLVPAFEMSGLTTLSDYSSEFLYRGDFLFSGLPNDSFAAYRDVVIVASCVFAGSFYFATGPLLDKITKVFVTFWMITLCLIALSMSEFADIFWRRFESAPLLQRPAALLPLLSLAIAALVPAADSVFREVSRKSIALFCQLYAGAFLVLVILATSYLWTRSASFAEKTQAALVHADPYLPALAELGGEPSPRLHEGPSVVAAVLAWSPRVLQVRTHAAIDSHIVLGQFYMPNWYARVKDRALRLRVEPSGRGGLLEVHVPSGEMEVDVVLSRTRERLLVSR